MSEIDITLQSKCATLKVIGVCDVQFVAFDLGIIRQCVFDGLDLTIIVCFEDVVDSIGLGVEKANKGFKVHFVGHGNSLSWGFREQNCSLVYNVSRLLSSVKFYLLLSRT